MACEALEGAKPGAFLADNQRGGFADSLIRACLQEFADPKAARVASSALGGQGVIGTNDLVAVGNIGLRAEEQSAKVF